MNKKADNYCWLCHKIAVNQENAKVCAKCPRIYHYGCLDSTKSFSSNSICFECIHILLAKKKEPDILGRYNFCELLSFILELIVSKWKLFETWPSRPEEDSKLYCIRDLTVLKDYVNAGIRYTTTAEFLSDLKWIHHNLNITYGSSHIFTARAKKMENEIKDHLNNLLACPECFIGLNICKLSQIREFWKNYKKNKLVHQMCDETANHSFTIRAKDFHSEFLEQLSLRFCGYHFEEIQDVESDLFTNTCRDVHKLVWVKLKRHPYYPAKVLKVVRNKADVIFFGSHDRGKVLLADCYGLTEHYPEPNAPNRAMWKISFHELKVHIEKYERNYGPYKYQSMKMPFDPSHVHVGKVSKKRRKSMAKTMKQKKNKTAEHFDESLIDALSASTTKSGDVHDKNNAIHQSTSLNDSRNMNNNADVNDSNSKKLHSVNGSSILQQQRVVDNTGCRPDDKQHSSTGKNTESTSAGCRSLELEPDLEMDFDVAPEENDKVNREEDLDVSYLEGRSAREAGLPACLPLFLMNGSDKSAEGKLHVRSPYTNFSSEAVLVSGHLIMLGDAERKTPGEGCSLTDSRNVENEDIQEMRNENKKLKQDVKDLQMEIQKLNVEKKGLLEITKELMLTLRERIKNERSIAESLNNESNELEVKLSHMEEKLQKNVGVEDKQLRKSKRTVQIGTKN